MHQYVIKLESEISKGSRISARVLNALLQTLLDVMRRSLRLCVEACSDLHGDACWLDAAADFELVGLDSDSTVLRLEARALGESVPRFFDRTPVWHNWPRPEQSAFDVFEYTIRDAINGNEESDWLDRNVLVSISQFGGVFDSGYRSCIFEGPGTEPVTITPQALLTVAGLCDRAAAQQKCIVSGTINQLAHGGGSFLLRLEADALRVVVPTDRVYAYGETPDERVVIEGVVTFRPSGRALAILAHSVRPAMPHDVVWERLPRRSPGCLEDVRPHNQLPIGDSGFERIFGKWPGSETDEEIDAFLEEIS